MVGHRTVFLVGFIWLWDIEKIRSMVHWNDWEASGALEITMCSAQCNIKSWSDHWGADRWCIEVYLLFRLRNVSTSLSHMRSLYIALIDYILSWLKLWHGHWTAINYML